MTKNFYNDEQKVLKKYLDRFLDIPPENNNQNKILDYTFSNVGVEFIVRPECNQKCEYCYIYRYGNELYPKETRVDKKTLLKNLQIFLNYYFNQRKVIFRRFELFAGDLFMDDLYFDIADIFYDYYKKIHNLFPHDFKEHTYVIMTPCNFSFCENKEKITKMIEYTNKFDELDIDLALSWSTDGLYAIDTREKRALDESFFDKIFILNKQLKFGIHPMIAPENIDVAIENYDWWLQKYKEFDRIRYNDTHDADFQPMLLEVRNDGWTEEKITSYLKFLKHMIEVRLQMCDNSIDQLARNLWYPSDRDGVKFEGDLPKLKTYDPILLTCAHDFNSGAFNDQITCSMQSILMVRLSDLTLPICHRLTYPQFIGGKYQLDDNKERIIDILPENVSTYISAKTMKVNCAPKCITCHANELCLKGCLGSQFETNGEYVVPIDSVCNLEKAKAAFLAKTYCEMGVIQSALKQNLLEGPLKTSILNFCDRMGYSYE